jgi:DNA-binding transcriptional MerR regulator
VGQGFQADTSQSFRIGELASRAAMTVDAIRFYEKRGLLPKAQRSAGRFRVYSPRDLERVRFIQQTPVLGFSLAEIREFVDLRNRKTEACETVRTLLQEKLAATRAKSSEPKPQNWLSVCLCRAPRPECEYGQCYI